MHVNPSVLANSNKNIYQNAVSRQKPVNDCVVLGQLRNRLYNCTWCSQHTRTTSPRWPCFCIMVQDRIMIWPWNS